MIKPSGGKREREKKNVEKNIDKNQVSVHVNEWVSGLWPYRSAATGASREQAYKIQKVNFSVVKFDNLLFWFSDLQIWWCDGAVTSVAAAPAIIKTRYYQKSIRIYLMLLFTILSKAQNFHISFQGFWLLFANTVKKFDGIKEIFYVRVNTKEARRQEKGWRWWHRLRWRQRIVKRLISLISLAKSLEGKINPFSMGE